MTKKQRKKKLRLLWQIKSLKEMKLIKMRIKFMESQFILKKDGLIDNMSNPSFISIWNLK
jgi:hypothetical protein